MNTINLKKKTFGRRRFIHSVSFADFSSWESYYFKLKEELEAYSHFQLLAPDCFLEVNQATNTYRVLISVLGRPDPRFSSFDQETGECYEFTGELKDYVQNREALFSKASAIKSALLEKVGQVYHIVLDGEKLSLHFFK